MLKKTSKNMKNEPKTGAQMHGKSIKKASKNRCGKMSKKKKRSYFGFRGDPKNPPFCAVKFSEQEKNTERASKED